MAELNAALTGRYAVERELGHGGMATVYLGEDVRHHRKVAIKVLRAELAAVIGAERFVREIQTIAALQHPHILGLIDSGEIGGTAYYVMPFVEGESLRDRLAREKQLPVDDAVRIATEVASALDYAHRHGIIHRDIKPENVMLHDGSAVVADFGIALAVSSAGTRMTETGMSLGTPHYMSPEQAMGDRDLGPRSDIYSLGCVVYEMLIGEPPFTGPTAQAVVARVVTDSPRTLSGQRKSVPPHVEAAVLRALEKLPADRFATAREFAEAMSGRAAMPPLVTNAGSAPSRPAPARVSRHAIAGVVAVVAVVAAYTIGLRVGRDADAGPEWTGELLGGPENALGPRVSPDGQTIAFQAMINDQTQVAVMRPGSGDWTVLTHDRTQGVAQNIAWSPDGARIYYSRFSEVPRGVWSISPLGGDERLVLENAGNPEPLPDGSVLVSRMNAEHRFQLYRFHVDNGRLDTLAASARFNFAGAFFRAFPDRTRVAYWGRAAGDSTTALRVVDLTTGESRLVLREPSALRLTDVAGLAISSNGKWIIIVRIAGNLARFVAVSADGSGRERVLFTRTSSSSSGLDVDAGPDGSLYFDEMNVPLEVHRYDPRTRRLERRVMGAEMRGIVPLPGGRSLIDAVSAGRRHVMIWSQGKDPARFVQADEASLGPALLGRDAVVLHLVGADDQRMLATVSIATGRIIKRFPVPDPGPLAGSVDGKTIFFVRGDQVWSLDVATGATRRLTAGVSVAVDPSGTSLVVERTEMSGVRLVRVPLDGSNEQEIRVRSELRLGPSGLASNSIAPDGRIAVRVVSPASWFYPAAILDPRSGAIELTASGLAYDMWGSGWTDDGMLVSSAGPLQARLWRLKPVGTRKWWE
jgi:eukaryotic-like serine/threonine-protein kinase